MQLNTFPVKVDCIAQIQSVIQYLSLILNHAKSITRNVQICFDRTSPGALRCLWKVNNFILFYFHISWAGRDTMKLTNEPW